MLDSLGIEHWLGPFARGEGIVFTLHRLRDDDPSGFAPNRSLQVTAKFLRLLIDETRRAGFEFVTIDQAIERMRGQVGSARPFAVLTFDDGYRDNFEVAAPILAREGVPWTLFVVPDFLEGHGRIWWLEIEEAVRRLDHLVCNIEGSAFVAGCRAPAAKMRVFGHLGRLCLSLSGPARIALLDQLAAQAGSNSGHLVRENCLSWDELREAARRFDLTIGSHTSSHAVLSSCGVVEAEREIADSKGLIEAELGRPVTHLAYPNGRTKSGRDAQSAFAAGYAAAWTSRAAHLTTTWRRTAPFAMPRVSVNGLHANKAIIHAVLSGVPFLGRYPSSGCRTAPCALLD